MGLRKKLPGEMLVAAWLSGSWSVLRWMPSRLVTSNAPCRSDRLSVFIIHPIEPQEDVARKFPVLGELPPGMIDCFSRFSLPIYLSGIAGSRPAATGEGAEGWLLACRLTPNRTMQVPVSTATEKIVQTGHLAERLGARLLGLGAFTSRD
jgi:hypothetical protein